jgi:DNA-directed RNA polymerase specialized sigma24 family protein
MLDIDVQTLEAAGQGSSPALEALLRTIQSPIYGLALRMLWHPEDARDATQEILLKVLTHLGTFRGESAFGRRSELALRGGRKGHGDCPRHPCH